MNILIKKKIAKLEVSMNNPCAIERTDTVGDLADKLNRLHGLEGPAHEALCQGLPPQNLHNGEGDMKSPN